MGSVTDLVELTGGVGQLVDQDTEAPAPPCFMTSLVGGKEEAAEVGGREGADAGTDVGTGAGAEAGGTGAGTWGAGAGAEGTGAGEDTGHEGGAELGGAGGVGGFGVTFGVGVEDTGTAGAGEGAASRLPDLASEEEVEDFSRESDALSHLRTFSTNSSGLSLAKILSWLNATFSS